MSPKLSCGRYDWREGIDVAIGAPRAYQPRRGGPPLLFSTDLRMTILVTLAQVEGPARCADLWVHIGRKNYGCLRGLKSRGLIAMWRLGKQGTFAALEPAHPASEPLRRLLHCVATVHGFKRPIQQLGLLEAIALPKRRSKIDPRCTFGDPTRTLPLLVVYVRGHANAEQVVRCIPRSDPRTVRQALLMFRAFHILKSQRISRGITYSLNHAHPLVPEIAQVLATLDHAMPQWRVVAEHDIASPRTRSR